MTEFNFVPFRTWGKDNRLVQNKQGKKVFDLAMKLHGEGKKIDMTFGRAGHDGSAPGTIYETISVTIED